MKTLANFLAVAAPVCLFSTAALAEPAKDYPIQPVPFTAVSVQDGFWRPRMETNRQVTVRYDFQKCEETGRIDNFAKAAGLMQGGFRGIPFDDSDVYKVIEGAAYSLALEPDPKLDKYLDDLIAKIAAAQEPDGYLYTARRLLPPEKMPGMSGKARWVNEASSHELYNAGHLYEAAVAHYQATGKRTLLAVAIKSANLVAREFGPGKVQNPPGHQVIEIGLAKLYRVTGDVKYLNLAKYLIDLRGRPETHKLYGAYNQDHEPVVEQDEAVGHAVRAGYLYSGVADVAALTGDAAYTKAIDRIWENVVAKKLYLTGGIGARHAGEAFGENYELPNASAYNETCAAIANALWNERMFLLHGDAKYLDVLERVVYNGFLSGVALTGSEFFYPNPLASGPGYQRSPWFSCACCPVNVVRFLPELAGYFYATRGDEAYVNLFAAGTARLIVAKTPVELRQETRYPWDGKVTISVTPQANAAFTLNVRIPGWTRSEPVPSDLYRYDDGLKPEVKLSLNGQPVALVLKQGFAQIRRTWQAGNKVELDLPMPVRRVTAHAEVKDDVDKFAIERGPLVYCAEGRDNGGKVLSRVLSKDSRFEIVQRPNLLGGIVAVKIIPPGQGDAVTTIPYCLWENRGPNENDRLVPHQAAALGRLLVLSSRQRRGVLQRPGAEEVGRRAPSPHDLVGPQGQHRMGRSLFRQADQGFQRRGLLVRRHRPRRLPGAAKLAAILLGRPAVEGGRRRRQLRREPRPVQPGQLRPGHDAWPAVGSAATAQVLRRDSAVEDRRDGELRGRQGGPDDLEGSSFRGCLTNSENLVGQECPTYNGRRMGILARRHTRR